MTEDQTPLEVLIVTREDESAPEIVAVFTGDHEREARELADGLPLGNMVSWELNPDIERHRITHVWLRRDGEPDEIATAMTPYDPYPLLGFEGFRRNGVMLFNTPGHDPAKALQQANEARRKLLEADLWPEELTAINALKMSTAEYEARRYLTNAEAAHGESNNAR